MSTAPAVRAEQIRTLYEHNPWIIALNPINASVVGSVLWTRERGPWIVAWVLATALVAAGRALLRALYLRAAPPVEEAPVWGRRYAIAAALTGLMWGAGTLLLYNAYGHLTELILVFVVGGMTAGAAGTLASYLPAFLCYAVPTVLPLAVRILLEGGRLHGAMGALGIVYGIALVVIVGNTNRAIRQAFRLRFVNEDLLARLSGAQIALEETNRTLEQRVEDRSNELQRQSEALDEARRMESLGLLVGGVAHDFNNLLTVILGNVTIMLGQPVVAAAAGDTLSQVQEAAERAAWLVNQLLASSRRQLRRPRVLDLNAVVAGTHKLLARLIGEHVELRVTLPARPLLLEADPRQLEQVIVNLATNARDAMPGGGCLTFETAAATVGVAGVAGAPGLCAGDYVVLSVSDTGVGMDAETRRMAFHPFFTTKEVGRGTGLGLATVNGIVEQGGGRVFVESEPGKGSCFRVYFPRSAGAVAVATEGAPAALSVLRRPATVLVAEDEPLVRAVVCQALTGAGLTVLEAEDGEEALDRAAAHAGPIDLLVTDVVMARLGGPEVARRLKADRPNLRVLFVSGYSRDAKLPATDLVEGIDFLEKPFTPSAIVDRVSRLLAGARTASAR